MSEWKCIIRSWHLCIYTVFFSLCQALLTLGSFNILTLSHWGGCLKPVSSQRVSLGFQVSLKSRILYPFGRVTTVWGPLHGEHQEFHGILNRMKWSLQKLMHRPVNHSIPPILWACNLLSKERWGWSNCNQSYLLGFTSVTSTSAARMPTFNSTHPLCLYIKHFTLYLSRISRKCLYECMEVPVHPY